MGRIKGSKNTINNTRPKISTLTSEERIKLLANLIIDKITEDQINEQVLFKKIQVKNV